MHKKNFTSVAKPRMMNILETRKEKKTAFSIEKNLQRNDTGLEDALCWKIGAFGIVMYKEDFVV